MKAYNVGRAEGVICQELGLGVENKNCRVRSVEKQPPCFGTCPTWTRVGIRPQRSC
jgi:hypothetical protein